MSDFHPETWNPGWSVATVAKGLLSFMCEDVVTTGAVVTSAEEKVKMAGESVAWNVSHGGFKSMFPEIANSSQLDSISEAGKGKKAKEGGEKGEGSGGDLADKVDSLGLD
jgi:ubiquitin-conjugating enzyme E2 J2